MKTAHWNAFLPVGKSLTSDEPGLDPAWAMSMGIDSEALTVLRRVRRDVLPLVRDLQKRKVLKSFSFLIHDRASGVPCPPEDTTAYIHGRFEIAGRHRVGSTLAWQEKWAFVTEVRPTPDELRVQAVLCEQTAWYLRFIEEAGEMSDLDLLRHVGQTLHYYANMAQMMVR